VGGLVGEGIGLDVGSFVVRSGVVGQLDGLLELEGTTVGEGVGPDVGYFVVRSGVVGWFDGLHYMFLCSGSTINKLNRRHTLLCSIDS
jgi:hypothetical protein